MSNPYAIHSLSGELSRLVLLFATAGCSIAYPDGKFACGENPKCPPGMFCREDNRCYNSPDPDGDISIDTDSVVGGRTTGVVDGEVNSQSSDATETGEADAESNGTDDGGAASGSGGTRNTDSNAGGVGDLDTDGDDDIETGGDGGIDASDGDDIDASDSDERFFCDDETCTDRITGLQWGRCTGGLSGSDCAAGIAEWTVWETAVNACADLFLADKDDWRLPSIYELFSIVDFSETTPSINSIYFPNTPSEGVWSSTDVLHPEEIGWVAAWGIDFLNGLISYDQKTSDLNPLALVDHYRRCVRGPKINARTFTKNDLVVLDDNSSLMWQACSAGQLGIDCSGTAIRYSWQDAKAYCEESDDSNHSDWRLPNVRELHSLIDYTRYNPAVDKIAFPQTRSDLYWSSTPIEGYPDHAWYVDFRYGHTKFDRGTELLPNTATALITRTYYVRCVRDET